MLPRDRALPLRRGSPRFSIRPSTLVVAGVVLSGITPSFAALLVMAALVVSIVAIHGAVRLAILARRGVEVLAIEPSLIGPLIEPAADAPTPEIETRDAIIAAAIPLTTFGVLAAIAWLWAPGERLQAEAMTGILRIVGGYALLQVMPGLPMDGGRIFHALVWYISGSATVATRAAARYAQLIAAGLVVAGFFMLPLGSDLSYWSVLLLGIGWQLSAAAATDAARSTWQRRGRTTTLERFIPGAVLPPTARVAHAARLILGRRVPILVWEGRTAIGVVTRASLRRVPRAEWHLRSIAEVMTPIEEVPHLAVDRTVAEAVSLLRQEHHAVLVVTTGSRPRAAVLLEQLLAPLLG